MSKDLAGGVRRSVVGCGRVGWLGSEAGAGPEAPYFPKTGLSCLEM